MHVFLAPKEKANLVMEQDFEMVMAFEPEYIDGTFSV